MSIDEPFIPPKKQYSILQCCGGLFVLPLSLFLMQQAGPSPAIVISRETTHITEPLKPNGLPDYEKYVLDLSRVEVDPEDNAAVLLCRAIWLGEFEPKDYQLFCQGIGLPHVPSVEDCLKPLHGETNRQRILRWLQERGLSNITPDGAETLWKNAIDRPWKVADFPPLAEWVRDNRSALALIADATQKPKFYLPSPSLLNDIDEPLSEILLPGAMFAREAARSLCVRSMGYLGEEDFDRAWRDILGCHRLARSVARGWIVDHLVAFEINGWASHATLAVLGQEQLSGALARRIRSDVESLAEFASLVDSYNTFERLNHLDLVLTLRSGKPGIWQKVLRVPDNLLKLARVPADWNIALRRGNEFYDHLVAIVQMPPGRARDEAVYQLHDDLDRMTKDFPRRARSLAQPDEKDLGDWHARATIVLFAPHLDSMIDAHERANTSVHLLRLAASLRVYRAEVGTYPEKLDDLVPRVLEKLPVDLYGARPFVYKRDGEGYVLYSIGRNGADDDGSNARIRVWKGRAIHEPDATAAQNTAASIPPSSDDVSIRVPRPPLALPLPPSNK